jgi:hypothetical protein
VRKRRRVSLPPSVLDISAAGHSKGQSNTEHAQRRVRAAVWNWLTMHSVLVHSIHAKWCIAAARGSFVVCACRPACYCLLGSLQCSRSLRCIAAFNHVCF